jgi:TolA-binding protein
VEPTAPAELTEPEPEPMDATIPEIAAEPAHEEIEVAPTPVPVKEELPAPVEVSAVPAESAVQEVDLSDEWSSLLEGTEEAPVEAPPPAPAKPAAAPVAHHQPGDVEEFQIGEELPITEAEDTPVAAAFESVETPVVPIEPEPNVEKPVKAPEAAKPKEVPAAKAPPKPPAPSETEFELEQEYELVLDAEPLVPAYDQKPPETPIAPREPEPVAQNAAPAPPAGSSFASDQFLADLASEIDQLGIGQLAPGFSGSAPGAPPPAAPKPAAPPAASAESGPLKEVFDEFRAELGEMGAEDEDLETHYNLGIAFREMGLLEEAISEFQKVAKATDQGRAFRYTMQCCTLLGLAFMEKGQPSIAAIWYERALKTPGNDPESVLALRYDLGVAQESAGEPEAALKSFSQVYAMNIDYRGVAERIAALQKPIRKS